MSEQETVATEDEMESFMDDSIEDSEEQENAETVEEETTEPEDSAPSEETEPEEQEKPAQDGFQKRINKVTADKYKEKSRADALEKEIELLKSKEPVDVQNEPKLEDFDYDETDFQRALVKHYAKQEVAAIQQQNGKKEQQKEYDRLDQEYADKVNKSGLKDYSEVVAPIIENKMLSNSVSEAIMEDEKGPEIAYYLGKNLEKAEQLDKMSTVKAIKEIGKISERLSATKTKRKTSAPAPVKPLGSGGKVVKNPDDMSMDDLMANDRY